MNLALKYRPQSFLDLTGQSHVVQTLKNSLISNRVGHAFLFSGSRGVGKTTVARVFAKVLRCQNKKDYEPCNECSDCTSITEGHSIDVIEIDGASNNGVESIRSIRENVVFTPSTGLYKIYIIDEVHMLSLSAFNALLKTLEEPPPHVVFIFATTEIHKIPLTILSRCQRFEFRRLKNIEVVERLESILAKEGVSLNREALFFISSFSDGSLRDALSLLDQFLSFASENKTYSEKDIAQALGVIESAQVLDYVVNVMKSDVPATLKGIQKVMDSGVHIKNFAEKCLEEFRLLYLLVLNKNNFTAESLDISPEKFKVLNELSTPLTLLQVERASQILHHTIKELQWASLPHYLLEMASIRICHLKGLESNPSAIAIAVASPEVTAPEAVESSPVASPVAAPSSPTIPPPKDWQSFVETLMKKKPLIGSLLTHAKVKFEENPKKVTLQFPKESFFEKQVLSYQTELQDQLKNFFGEKVGLVVSSEAMDTQDMKSSLEEVKKEEEDQLKKEALSHPQVLKVKELLSAEVVGVKINNEYHAT